MSEQVKLFNKYDAIKKDFSGITTYIINKKSKSIGMNLLFKSGSNNESYLENNVVKNHKRGVAHFLEHKLFVNCSTNESLIEDLLKRNIFFNGATEKNTTQYYVATNEKDFYDFALEKVLKITCCLDVTIEEIEKEKGIILAEKAMKTGDALFEEEQLSILSKGFSEEFDTIGTQEDLEHMTLADLELFYKQNYAKDNAVLIFIGDFDNKEKIAKLERNFNEQLAKIVEQYPLHIQDKKANIKPNLTLAIKADQSLKIQKFQTSSSNYKRTYFINKKDLNYNTDQFNKFKYLLIQLSKEFYNSNPKIIAEFSKYNITNDKIGYLIVPMYMEKNIIRFAIRIFTEDKKLAQKYLNVIENILCNIDKYYDFKHNEFEIWKKQIEQQRELHSSFVVLFTKLTMAYLIADFTSLGLEHSYDIDLLTEENIKEFVAKLDLSNYYDTLMLKE